MREIQLTQGKVALVDDVNFDRLASRSWCYDNGYAWAKIDKKKQSMHRFLMDVPKGMDVDHINDNGCDNRRCNLRIVTRSQNMANMHNNRGGTSNFKGVTWHKRDQKWCVGITVNKRKIHIGYFALEKEAALAYDISAIKYFGQYAKVNFE